MARAIPLDCPLSLSYTKRVFPSLPPSRCASLGSFPLSMIARSERFCLWFFTTSASLLLFACNVFLLHAALIANNFEISSSGCRLPAAAFSTASRKSLVVWADYNVTRIAGRLVTDEGAVAGAIFEISEAPFGGLYPAGAYNAANDEFLVTWDSFGTNLMAEAREGSIMTKAISTAGRASVQVEYDVMARLNAPPSGSLSGSCAVLEGSIEDKLVVYYSTTGTNGPWTVAQILSEGVELPTDWARKLINLAGVGAVSNNANFALRFQWQFNSGTDTGRIDNVHLLSGAVTAPTPSIGLSVTSIERTVQAGQNLPNDPFRVSNAGEGTLDFTVNENVPWLSIS